MTSDFKPGKAYLIEGKGIEQVKNEIKEWLGKKELHLEEDGDHIHFCVCSRRIGNSVENNIAVKQHGKDTLIIFHEKETSSFNHEMRKNLIRSLSNKKEIPFGSIPIITYLAGICLSVFFVVYFFLYADYDHFFSKYRFILLLIFVLFTFIQYLHTRISASSPNSDYYVEEYKDLNMFKEVDEFDLKRKFTCPNCNRSIKENWDTCLYCSAELTLGKHHLSMRKHTRALVFISIIILIIVSSKLFFLNSERYIAEGSSLYNQGNYDKALKKFDMAIMIEPNNAYAWNGKGLCLNKKGKYSEAIECFGNALELDPNYAIAWFCKGLSLQSLGRNAEAQECFDKAKELGYKQS